MSYSKVYVLCPYGLVTGGPDALHQMVYYMNDLGFDAHIVYCDIKKRNRAIPKAYLPYVKDYLLVEDIVDEEANAFIVPETLTHYLDKYTKLHKYVWWLSVDNNETLASNKNKLKKITKKVFSLDTYKKLYKIRTLKDYLKNKKYEFKDDGIKHLCASYYAYDHVSKNIIDKANVSLLIEPISKYFLNHPYKETKKENIVLYNPKKNGSYLNSIMKKANDVTFKKLKGFNQQELIEIYSKAKLYIDFGTFPGAERMPKEAVKYGCAIITGKRGASAFYNDVVIKDEYKFDETESNVDLVVNKIHLILDNYESIYHDFDEYRKVVDNLESNFVKNLKEEFFD